MQKLEGSVEQIVFCNEDNGYTVCDLSIEDDIVTVCGIMPMLCEGDRLCVYGKWVHSPKYGRQFSAEQYERLMPADTASMLRYLSSRAIKGIGPKTAVKIVEEFGEDTFDVIENHPEWLANVKGVSVKMAMAASESFKEQAGIRTAMMFFRDYFGTATTVKIYKKWGSASVDIAKKNPYRLCNEIDGIGFERADAMAGSLGLRNGNFDRIMSGLSYILMRNSAQNGHVCLPREKLAAASAELLEVSVEDTDRGISELIRMGRFKYVMCDEEQMIYLSEAYDEEKYIAEKLVLLEKMCVSVDIQDVDRFIEREEAKAGIEYARLQKQAISDALRYGVLVLTGGPGTGKTTVVRALIRIFDSMGYFITLAAPTGRAAKRMSEATMMDAKTIHRLLEMSYDPDGRAVFNRNEFDLLDEQVIIVDEASMIDSTLMCALLKAIKPGARIIIIGDSDQLPSVGAGNVLRDIIDSNRFSTVRLTEIFRQAQESLIVTNAHAINNGHMPDLSVKDKDFFYLRRTTDRDIANTVADLCKNRLPRAYGDMAKNGIQVICASRKGESGTENLNIMLQQSLNPKSNYKREYVFRDRVFREGDRIMQTRNNYDIEWTREYDGKTGCGVFNGDIGIIETINSPENEMTVLFDDRRVVYDFSLLEDLEHAYAVTVHKSQGSEYPIVVMPMCSAPLMLHTRNLLYTAVTRAQNMVILVGREDIIAEMVENNRQSMRYTGLCRRLGGNNENS
ncbi:MAG: ATP-dependent RecD-like DNA helicase [Clostridia bacterium]|nr:ATP-dependent RecD-like DNA helicase [Clostridia bacterium]